MWSLHADRDPAMPWLEVHLALASQEAFLAPNSARFLLPRIKTRDRLAARFQLVDQFMADFPGAELPSFHGPDSPGNESWAVQHQGRRR